MSTEVIVPEAAAPLQAAPSAPASPSSALEPSSSSLDRPFKIIVQSKTFLIDSESMRKMSPIFSIMCYGRDFDKMELSREIVDEKSADVDVFLKAVNDPTVICVRNFATILRLANKYQVEALIDECERFVMTTRLSVLKPDEVLTLLIACHDYHVCKDAMVALIRRLSEEEQTTFNRLKLSRFLPAQLYGAVVGANLNQGQIREMDTMNGHYYKMERNKTRWRRSACDQCKAITDAATCDGCHKTLCKFHTSQIGCGSEYGRRMLRELKANVVELEWD